MLVTGIIDLVAKRLDLDVDDYYPEVMIAHVNAAISRINNGLIKATDPEVIKQMTITGDTAKPADFFRLAKGSYPVVVGGNISLAYGAPASVTFSYFTFKPPLTSVADTIPLPDYCISEIVDYVCIHINNDFEANVTQDVGLATSDEALLFGAKGG